METRLSLVFLKNTMRTWSPSMFLLIGKILSLSFVNIMMEIMSLLYYLLNRGIMSPETMSPSAMGIRTYSLLFLPLQSIKFCLVFVSLRQMCAKFRISNFVSRLPTPWTPSWRRLMERWQQVWRCKRKLLEHYGPILLTIYLGQPFLGEESLIIKVENNEATFIK